MSNDLTIMHFPDDWNYGGPGRGNYSQIAIGKGKRVLIVVYGPNSVEVRRRAAAVLRALASVKVP